MIPVEKNVHRMDHLNWQVSFLITKMQEVKLEIKLEIQSPEKNAGFKHERKIFFIASLPQIL